ncbi:hypothetical protein H7K24_04065 [Mycobacterium fragae]|uniref:Uncharacterized protein n=1 Tax=Mycobacterium fragae TaxID=1260918 RepID=A0A1X1V4P4_9MYCO|nr:hypothetical protein [Mycobacterium fragae]MCV7399328.1 hypothetical protein [Mycobacterium fragae]ORV63969.1 hypothetical protein AWC06_08285 [Mycobacterium fragae]
MTFNHQIDFNPAATGSAATVLKAGRLVIVPKPLSLRRLPTVPDQQQRCICTTGATFAAHDMRWTRVCGEDTAGNVGGGDQVCTEAADTIANG